MNQQDAITLNVIPGVYSVCKLPADAPAPAFPPADQLFSITRIADETSIVIATSVAPRDCIAREDGFRILQVAGQLDFALTGVLSSILAPLAAAAQISVFTISTFDTDYILVRAGDLSRAIEVLEASKTARVNPLG